MHRYNPLIMLLLGCVVSCPRSYGQPFKAEARVTQDVVHNGAFFCCHCDSQCQHERANLLRLALQLSRGMGYRQHPCALGFSRLLVGFA
jgi:hypothetical protein